MKKMVSTTVMATALLASLCAHAQLPACSPARLVVAFPPGGPTDAMARALAVELGKRTHWNVVVENKPGAGSAIGTTAVAKAPPDGCTLGLASHSLSMAPALYPKLGYDMDREIVPVALVATFPSFLLARPDFPHKSIKEILDQGARQPFGVATPAIVGVGTLAIEQLNKAQGSASLFHVPYKGSSPAHIDLLSGRVPLMFDAASPATNEYIRAGKLKAIAVTGSRRDPAFPNVPTIAEAGYPQAEVMGWLGVITTGGTPPTVVTALNAEVEAILKEPEMRARLAGVAYTPEGGSPERFATFLRSETRRWGSMIKELNLKPE